MLSLIVATLLLRSPARAASTQQIQTPTRGHLEARVVVVDELIVRPVALTDFELSGPTASNSQKIRTDADGKISIDLDPGNYVLTNASPLTFKGKDYTWNSSFAISSGQTYNLSLTQADALSKDAAPTREISDAAKLYQRYVHSVVTVESDSGHGSGFLVDSKGLILTNYHVANGSDFLAVKFGPGLRYEARAIAEDSGSDVAVLQVSADACKGLEPLPLLAPSDSLGVEGESVIAIGSPLNQQQTLTQGIISKVQPDALISDVNINHGNSGGPLLNMAGFVIGITTFADLPGKDQGGPGISGIVSIHKAESALAQAQSALSTTTALTKLPDVSTVEIPDDMLQNVGSAIKGDEPYFKAPKNFRTYIETPFDVYAGDLAFQKARDRKIARRYKGQVPTDQQQDRGPRAFWLRYVGDANLPLVTVKVIPWPQEKSSSVWNRVLLGPSSGPAQLELRDDFANMTLLRDGKEVVPIGRNRIRDTEIYDGYGIQIDDTAMAGLYSYDPRTFEPSGDLELRIWKNDKQDYTSIKIDKGFQKNLWDQFKGWVPLAEGTPGPIERDLTPAAPPNKVARPPAQAPSPAPAPAPVPPPAPVQLPTLVGELEGLEPDPSAIEARIKNVTTPLGSLKPWDTIIAVKGSESSDFENVDSWASLHNLLLREQVRGETSIKVRRGNDTITAKAIAR